MTSEENYPEKHLVRHFDNGLTLIAEQMDWCESVACAVLVPGGSIYDPTAKPGLSNLVCEMALRGAGDYDSHGLIEAFESLGSERGESVGHAHLWFSFATLADNLVQTLKLTSEIILNPHFPENQLELGKQVVLQEILSVEDDPSRKVMIELSKNAVPAPWGEPCFGTAEAVESITMEEIRNFHKRYYHPNGAIVSVAGKFHPDSLVESVSNLFGDWKPNEIQTNKLGPLGKSVLHIPYESAQTHIGLNYPAVPFRHPDYLLAWSGVSVLSGGMSNRLYTEIREKRGLCYSVGASYYTYRDFGGVTCYCGTSSDRAQESLDVLLEQLELFSKSGITEKELELLKIRAKTSLIMQQESTGSRASSIARDWHHLGRIRTMSEIEEKINALTVSKINDYLAAHPPGPYHLVTLGPNPLEMNGKSF